jgi:hypothetical protein
VNPQVDGPGQSESRGETLRLDEVLAICAEYQEQISREIEEKRSCQTLSKPKPPTTPKKPGQRVQQVDYSIIPPKPLTYSSPDSVEGVAHLASSNWSPSSTSRASDLEEPKSSPDSLVGSASGLSKYYNR